MDILNQIIEKLSKEEIRNFKLFYGKTTTPEERKDLLLFNYIRSSAEKFDELKAIGKLGYDKENKNNYYRLKNRLIEDIGDSLLLLHAHKNELYELLQFVQLFYVYYGRNLYKTCLFYLRKAERLANSIENYELLDVVYANFIRLSANMIEIEPAIYIEKRRSNAVIVANLRDLDDLLATLSYRLKVSQNFGSQDKGLLKELQGKVREISRHTTSGFGKNLEARIYHALSKIFLQQHNYPALERLVKDTYQKFEKEKWFDKSNHELKLQMLTYCANALYKIGLEKFEREGQQRLDREKFSESLSYAEKLGEELQAYGKLHYEKYLFFYYNARYLNYQVLDPQQGLKVLDEFEREMRKKENTYYDFFIYLNRATSLYDTGRYKDSLKSLVRLYISEGYEKADKSFKLKIEVCELIITFEAADTEALQYRIPQVRKTFATLKNEPQFKRDFEVIQLLEDISASANYKRDEKIQKKIAQMLKAKVDKPEEDAEIIKYRQWLQRLKSNA
jgi:hypothetical protein